MDNQQWTIQRHWQHWVGKYTGRRQANQENTTQRTEREEQHEPNKKTEGWGDAYP